MTLLEQDQSWTTLGITQEPMEQYHGSVGMSYGGLKHFSVSPAHYLIARSVEHKETTAQRIGTLCHMAVLEIERFNREVFPIEGHRGAAKTKELIADAESRGKFVVKPEEYNLARKVQLAVLQHRTAKNLFMNGEAEPSMRWRDSETGLLLRARPDYLNRAKGVIADLKTFGSLEYRTVERQITKMKYHWQSALYLTGMNTLLQTKSTYFAHVFVDIDTIADAPMDFPLSRFVRVFVLGDASLEKAGFEIQPLIQQYAHCLKTNEWPGYPDDMEAVELPSWAWGEGF